MDVLSAGAGFVPGVGEVQDATIALTGYDPVTFDRQDTSTRVLSFAAFFIPEVGGKALSEAFSGVTKLISRIGEEKSLIRLAEEAGSRVQRSLDTLVSKLASGNLTPGTGTKKLMGDISYARTKDGARVFFRPGKDGKTIEILAKSDKKNEAAVIAKLKELYGKK